MTCYDVYTSLRSIIIRNDPDPMHGRGKSCPRIPDFSILPTRFIGVIYDLAFLHFPHAYPDSYGRLKRQTDDLVIRSKKIITISNATKSDIVAKYGYPPEDITVAYPGVDDRFTNIGPFYRHQRPYFLSVGSLKRQKNVPVVIRAFEEFCKHSEVRHDLFIVGGDVWSDPEIGRMLGNSPVRHFVHLVGHVSDRMLSRYYRGASALISPSLHEGFCLPVAEAMSSGCPVIASDTGSIPEIVGKAGICIPYAHPERMADEMLRVSKDQAFRSALIARGLNRAKRYTWNGFAQTVLGVIQSCMNE